MPSSSLPDLRDFNRSQLTAWVKDIGQPAFRAKQIFAWLNRPGITDFEQMTDLSKELRATLQNLATFTDLSLIDKEESQDGTKKYGFSLADGAVVESVLIPDGSRNTLCISSQVGCAMACAFCLTATMGFKRNLTPMEIVGQVRGVLADLGPEQRIHNIVYMGMGEPLANFNHVDTSLDILCDELGLALSAKRITVSTCGLVPQISELGKRGKLNLAISLHAASDTVRDNIMPVNKRYPISELLEACRNYPLEKRQKITFEYILLAGVNDSIDDARSLAKLLRSLPCKINLLPCNEAPEIPFRKPKESQVLAFQDILKRAGYTVLIRSSRGDDISAACGQLAAQHHNKKPARK